MLGCSFRQWHRLKGRVTDLGNPRRSPETWATFFYGVAITGGFSFAVERASTESEGMMQAMYLVVVAAFGIAGLVIHFLSRDANDRRTSDAKDIVDEMDVVEEAWIRSEKKADSEL